MYVDVFKEYIGSCICKYSYFSEESTYNYVKDS